MGVHPLTRPGIVIPVDAGRLQVSGRGGLSVMPQIRMACSGASRIARVVLAMLSAPSSRSLPMAGFRRAAIARGALPVWTTERAGCPGRWRRMPRRSSTVVVARCPRLGDLGDGPGAGDDCAGADQQQADQGIPPPATRTRVGYALEVGAQAAGVVLVKGAQFRQDGRDQRGRSGRHGTSM